MTSRWVFITSSYSTRCLRISKLWPSTLVWADSIAFPTMLLSMGMSSAPPTPLPVLALPVLLRASFVLLAAEDDVGAATGHVGGDGDAAQPARLGNDARLLLVVLGVEHLVRNPFALERS